jgi:hypothetical protein
MMRKLRALCRADRREVTLRTGAWADLDSVERYAHSETTEEAQKAIHLPTPKRGGVVEISPERKKA